MWYCVSIELSIIIIDKSIIVNRLIDFFECKKWVGDFVFYDQFIKMCENYLTTPAKVRKDLGISQSTMASWKSRGLTPKYETLQKLADYFGISVDALLLGDTSEERQQATGKVVFDTSKIVDALNVTLEREKRKDRYIKAFDLLNDDGQQKAVEAVEIIAGNPDYQK